MCNPRSWVYHLSSFAQAIVYISSVFPRELAEFYTTTAHVFTTSDPFLTSTTYFHPTVCFLTTTTHFQQLPHVFPPSPLFPLPPPVLLPPPPVLHHHHPCFTQSAVLSQLLPLLHKKPPAFDVRRVFLLIFQVLGLRIYCYQQRPQHQTSAPRAPGT